MTSNKSQTVLPKHMQVRNKLTDPDSGVRRCVVHIIVMIISRIARAT